MSDLDERVRSNFSDDDISAIKDCAITLASGAERDALQLAGSWEAHVEKIDSDRSLPWSDRTVWNEFDLSATMIVRDHLERAISALPAALSTRMADFVADTDSRFMSITVRDSGKRMAAVSNTDIEGRGWWWFRIPDSGPILEDLARWSRVENE